jgi:hypothetical protein
MWATLLGALTIAKVDHRTRNVEAAMRPLYDARIEDLGPRDLVKVECPCGHTERLTEMVLTLAGAEPYQKVLDLARRLRCRECDAQGDALVSVVWAK